MGIIAPLLCYITVTLTTTMVRLHQYHMGVDAHLATHTIICTKATDCGYIKFNDNNFTTSNVVRTITISYVDADHQ